MKNQIKKILFFGLLLINTIAFAFPGNIDGGTSGTNDPQAPIDNYIYEVFVFAIGFAFWENSKKVATKK